jgi:ATP-binding cassette subfamily C protein
MELFFIFARRYPVRSFIALVCLTLAAFAEGIGLSTMLPLLAVVARPADAAGGSQVEMRVRSAFTAVGMEPTLGALTIVVIGAMCLKAVLVLIANRHVGYTTAHVATDLRLTLLRTLMATRWEYYVKQPIGQLANSFATEAFRASQGYLYGAQTASFCIQAIVYAALALAVSWQVTVGAAVIGGTTYLLLHRFVRASRRAGIRETRLIKSVLGRLTDLLYAVKPLKAMGRERIVAPLLENETRQLNKALRRDVSSKETLQALQEPVLDATIVGGIYTALKFWHLAMDRVFVMAVLFGRLLSHLNKIQKTHQRMANAESAFYSIRDIIAGCEAVREVTTGKEPPRLRRHITLHDVNLDYGERDVLTGVSLEMPAGRMTVLIGPSGSGKTSIVDLVTGLVKPRSGEIRVDGVPLTSIDLAAWRSRIGYVPQEMLLLHESVRFNITLGDTKYSEADVEHALKSAGAWDFVCALPQGMDTPVGERGARLSGGQRQRVAIARALVHRPLLLILDEATANLDPATAAAIMATMRSLRDEVTVLAVSHQHSLLEGADVVYRIEHGRAAEVTAEMTPGSPARVA